jgi:exonuclease VII small subunit
MPPQYVFTIIIDLAVIALLVAVFLRTGRGRGGDRSADTAQIRNLELSLKKVMADSSTLSDELIGRFDEKLKELTRILERIDTKGKRLEAAIMQGEEVLSALEKSRQQAPQAMPDPYQKAADLIARGCSDDQVHREIGLSHDEINLIRQLAQSRNGTL